MSDSDTERAQVCVQLVDGTTIWHDNATITVLRNGNVKVGSAVSPWQHITTYEFGTFLNVSQSLDSRPVPAVAIGGGQTDG